MADKNKPQEDKDKDKGKLDQDPIERQAPGREDQPGREDFPEEPDQKYPPVLGQGDRPMTGANPPDVSEQVNEAPR